MAASSVCGRPTARIASRLTDTSHATPCFFKRSCIGGQLCSALIHSRRKCLLRQLGCFIFLALSDQCLDLRIDRIGQVVVRLIELAAGLDWRAAQLIELLSTVVLTAWPSTRSMRTAVVASCSILLLETCPVDASAARPGPRHDGADHSVNARSHTG